MESSLTQLEMDAVVQLIQLSGGGGDFGVFWVDFPAKKEEIERRLEREENSSESVGETSSSSVINPAENSKFLEEALPRRRKRVLSIADIYRKTAPLIDNRTLKRSKI